VIDGVLRTARTARASTAIPSTENAARPGLVPSMKGYAKTPLSWTNSSAADGVSLTLVSNHMATTLTTVVRWYR
jgi:hypothetical protein